MAESKKKGGSKKELTDVDKQLDKQLSNLGLVNSNSTKRDSNKPSSASSETKINRMQSFTQKPSTENSQSVNKETLETKQEIELKEHEKDIDQRQRLIDRLLEELDNRTEAVRKVGQDLYKLREVNASNEVYS